MKRASFALVCACAILAACETTGDPRQGGLFGWSETKARQRQAEKRDLLAQSEAGDAREAERSAQLRARERRSRDQIQTAGTREDRTADRLEAHLNSAFRKARHLENESPTPATASRAREIQGRIQFTARDATVPVEERIHRLRAIEQQIDADLAALTPR